MNRAFFEKHEANLTGQGFMNIFFRASQAGDNCHHELSIFGFHAFHIY